MASDYLTVGNGVGNQINKLVTIDKNTAAIHIKFDAARPDLNAFIDGGFRLFDEFFGNIIQGIDTYFSTNAGPRFTFNLTYAVNLTAGQRVQCCLQSSGAAAGSNGTLGVRNVRISTDPIP